MVKSISRVVVEPSKQPQFLGQNSGITLAKMVMSAIRVDALPSPLFSEKRTKLTPSGPTTETALASLPPRHAADHLVGVYFQYITPHLPIIDRSQVEAALKSAYSSMSAPKSSQRAIERDIFTTYMVLAIALCDLPNPEGRNRPSQSEGCFLSALGCIEKVITYSKTDIESLRSILLLAQFVALSPSRGSLSQLAGIALRLCIDIGLHWETEEQALNMDPDVLHERRCLWYSAYQFDRILCVTLGRPFGITDESARVPLPNPWAISRRSPARASNNLDIHNQRAHNHLFSMSKLESEIKHVQQSQTWTVKLAYPRPNYSAWVKDIEPRLQEWYTTIPQLERAHPTSIFAQQAYWDVVYSNAILQLHRPNHGSLHLSNEALFISFEASCKLIVSIKSLQRDGKIDVMWKSVYQLFMAGLGVIYCLWQSKELRDRNPVRTSISTLQSCASTLSAMSETFPGASGCRDVFDTLSSATVDWMVTNDAEEIRQNRLEFEKQVQDLMQQWQPSREGMFAMNDNGADNMSNMLSADNFAFSEILSSAAQWPELDEIDFSNVLSDSMQMAGNGLGAYNFM